MKKPAANRSCHRLSLQLNIIKHHLTKATNIQLANYLPHHRLGCTEVAALKSRPICFHVPGLLAEGKRGRQKQARGARFEAHEPKTYLQHPKFARDSVTPPPYMNTQCLSVH